MREGKALAMTALDVLANTKLLAEVVRDFVTPESLREQKETDRTFPEPTYLLDSPAPAGHGRTPAGKMEGR